MSPADTVLAEWAVRLTIQPSSVTPDDIKRLRDVGFDDRAIHDAAQVVSYFNYINRMADSLGVDEETWLRRWEEPDVAGNETPSC